MKTEYFNTPLPFFHKVIKQIILNIISITYLSRQWSLNSATRTELGCSCRTKNRLQIHCSAGGGGDECGDGDGGT